MSINNFSKYSFLSPTMILFFNILIHIFFLNLIIWKLCIYTLHKVAVNCRYAFLAQTLYYTATIKHNRIMSNIKSQQPLLVLMDPHTFSTIINKMHLTLAEYKQFCYSSTPQQQYPFIACSDTNRDKRHHLETLFIWQPWECQVWTLSHTCITTRQSTMISTGTVPWPTYILYIHKLNFDVLGQTHPHNFR